MDCNSGYLFFVGSKNALVLPIFCGFLLRLALPMFAWIHVGNPHCFWFPDSDSYVAPALQLAAGHGFLNSSGTPELFRTPGYPLLLVPGAWLDAVEGVGVGLQIVLGTLMIPLVASMVGRLRLPASLRLAAWWQAIDPLSIVLGATLLSETLFTFVVALALWVLLEKRDARTPVGGLLVGFAILVRPAGLYLPLFLTPVLLRFRGWKWAMVFLVCSYVLPASWVIRNATLGTPIFSVSSTELLDCYYRPAIVAQTTDSSYYAQRIQMGCLDGTAGKVTLAERDRRSRQAVLRHPGAFASVQLKGFLRAMGDPGLFDAFKISGEYPQGGGLLGVASDKGIGAAVAILWHTHRFLVVTSMAGFLLLVLFYAMSLGGLWQVWRERKNLNGAGIFLLLAALFYFLIFSCGPQAEARFRLPAVPILAILTAGIFLKKRLAWQRGAPATAHTSRKGGPPF